MAKHGKRHQDALKQVDRDALMDLGEVVKFVKDNAKTKFDETIEISMNLGIDPRHADQQVRGAVALPHGTGKDVRVAVFARNEKAEEATAAGADIVGAEDLMEKIQGGWMEFDRCIASPDMMAIVGRLGKVLGPRNLMPNPKLGTVSPTRSRRRRLVKFSSAPKRPGLSKPVSARRALPQNSLKRTRVPSSPPSRPHGRLARRVPISSAFRCRRAWAPV